MRLHYFIARLQAQKCFIIESVQLVPFLCNGGIELELSLLINYKSNYNFWFLELNLFGKREKNVPNNIYVYTPISAYYQILFFFLAP